MSTITEAQIDAYMAVQWRLASEYDRKQAQLSARERCRSGLDAALAATGTPQVPAASVDLVNALLLEAEKFWWNDGPERKSAEPMNAAKRAVLEALASQGAAPASGPQTGRVTSVSRGGEPS